jgi:hypothetical protein
MRPGRSTRPADSRVYRARLLLTLDDGWAVAAELAEAIGSCDQWVANAHDTLLAA